MFGGGLPHSVLAAALVLDALPGFAERYTRALQKARELFEAVDRLPGISVKPLPDGSNIFPLELASSVDPAHFVAALAERDVIVPEGAATLTVNTSVTRQSNEELLGAFRDALGAARH